MDLRQQFISLALNRDHTVTELSNLFNISRKTGHKWLQRFYAEGASGLMDRSRAPKHIPNQIDPTAILYLLHLRQKHPKWGARKCRQHAEKWASHLDLPCESTVYRYMRLQGMTKKKPRRYKPGHPGRPFTTPKQPNDIWTTDFKGHFKLLNGKYCYPLTVMDEYSRFVLEVKGLESTGYNGSIPRFVRLFKEFGLPKAIKSDNGIPFATNGLTRLSKLSVLWIKLGIEPILIEPASPQQNGKHERMHRTLKADCTIPPSRHMNTQQKRFNSWKSEYNYERPHDALEGNTPMDLYRPSENVMPDKLPKPDYPDHFEVRYVSANNCIRWESKWVGICSALAGEHIGLEEVDNNTWAVYFFWKRIGFMDVKTRRIRDPYGRLTKRNV
ncbi:MAG: integrase core domain-containing protein [Candidatus Marinimicrobia bacterium]|nr:integrase core domain-containing protein [Candidatus Neomarinimicrobiota bacterium]